MKWWWWNTSNTKVFFKAFDTWWYNLWTMLICISTNLYFSSFWFFVSLLFEYKMTYLPQFSSYRLHDQLHQRCIHLCPCHIHLDSHPNVIIYHTKVYFWTHHMHAWHSFINIVINGVVWHSELKSPSFTEKNKIK